MVRKANASVLAIAVILVASKSVFAFIRTFRYDLGPGVQVEVYENVFVEKERLKQASEGQLRQRIKALMPLAQVVGESSSEPKVDLLAAYLALRSRTKTTPQEDEEIFELVTSDPSIVRNVFVDIPYLRNLPSQMTAGLRQGVSLVSNETGVILGLLEADPASEVTLRALPVHTSISRSFKGHSSDASSDPNVVYAISLAAEEATHLPAGTSYKMASDVIQPIFIDGKAQSPTWSISFDAEKDFGEVTIPLTAKLLKYNQKQDWLSRKKPDEEEPIDVPISKPRIKPEPTPETPSRLAQVWVPLITAIIGCLGGIAGALITTRKHRSRSR